MNNLIYFSCQDFLNMESMAESVLLAGEDAMDQQVLRANVVENRNILDWVSAGDIIITSGYSFKDSTPYIVELLARLQAAGAVGFCLKPLHYINDIPMEIVEEARRIHFPLIKLPLQSIFTNIVHEVIEKILRKKSEAFRQEQASMEQLLNCVSQNEDMARILETIESLIHNPVVILEPEEEIVMTAMTKSLLPFLQNATILRSICQKIYQGYGTVSFKENEYPVFVLPIDDKLSRPSFLIICGYHKSIQDSDLPSINQINKILALEFRSKDAIKQIKARYKNKFIQDWIMGTFGDEIDICLAGNATGHHLTPGQNYFVGIIDLPKEFEHTYLTHMDSLSRVIRRMNQTIMFTLFKGRLIFILKDTGQEDISSTVMLPFVSQLISALSSPKLSLYTSGAYPAQDVPAAYEEALKICHIGQRCNIRKKVITRQDLGIFSLLALLPDSPSVLEYKNQFLQPLYEYDTVHNTKLVDTLKCYLEHSCNKKITAQILFAHYNTVSYRLGQIEELLQLKVDAPNTRLQLEIAFKLELIYAEHT